MFENYPIKLIIQERNEEDLNERLSRLKSIFSAGVNSSMFKGIISNLHNNQQQRPETWNKKNLDEWVIFLNPYLTKNVNENQLKLLFDYLVTYHSSVIKKNGEKYDMVVKSLSYNDKFLLEHLALKVLDI
tara:strand:- start:17932 stop:18321 length:390 start_codon:yes stop_codon:yes gene_type:complete